MLSVYFFLVLLFFPFTATITVHSIISKRFAMHKKTNLLVLVTRSSVHNLAGNS